MEINADIGEMTGADREIMPHISIGNIACGYHASNPDHMAETVRLATSHGVKISAHPSYLDRENFGRVSVPHSEDELVVLLENQIGLLEKICVAHGVELFAIKPHGALYHDMMRNEMVRGVISASAARYELPLVVQWMPQSENQIQWSVPVLTEVFADRAYDAEGLLKPRSEPGSLYLEKDVIIQQARQLIDEGNADTLCFHGDNPASVAALKCFHAKD